MKINELLNEALPGVAKPGLFSRMFGGGQDAKVKASIDQGTKTWLAVVKNLQNQGKINNTTTPQQYAEIFRLWSANVMNLPAKHPEMNKIVGELIADIATDSSEKSIKNAVTKLVNLSQTLAAAGPEARYTPEMKAQAVINVIDKQYGKYIKDIATKQAFVKFVNDAVKANPNISVDDLQKEANAELTKLTGTNDNSVTFTLPSGGTIKFTFDGTNWLDQNGKIVKKPSTIATLNAELAKKRGTTP